MRFKHSYDKNSFLDIKYIGRQQFHATVSNGQGATKIILPESEVKKLQDFLNNHFEKSESKGANNE